MIAEILEKLCPRFFHYFWFSKYIRRYLKHGRENVAGTFQSTRGPCEYLLGPNFEKNSDFETENIEIHEEMAMLRYFGFGGVGIRKNTRKQQNIA